MNASITLTEVLCVPTFTYNLLFISKLFKDTNCQVSFLADKCHLQDPSWTKAHEIGKEESRLYVFEKIAEQTTLFPAVHTTIDNDDGFFAAHTIYVDKWHARM